MVEFVAPFVPAAAQLLAWTESCGMGYRLLAWRFRRGC